ncbi:MAG: low specificity L-threonine aldolase [Bacteroidales bacterium]|jgi:threonine aldolase
MKVSFLNDYSEGAHPKILEQLSKTNYDQMPGYGEDPLCRRAEIKIKTLLNNPNANVHFVSGGTQANLLCISSFLKPFESVIAVKTAHIEIHEAGAIEFTGHKINTYEGKNGKITPQEIEEAILYHYDEHMVKPKIVFISNSTELGTVYTNSELTQISEVCKKHSLYLYIDGARLGSALTSKHNDLSLQDMAKYCDAFYIGGTKNGALIGEAIVICNPELQNFFRYHMKQKGALLAKSRLIGAQFDVLFDNNLYFELASYANSMAEKLSEGLKLKNIDFLIPPSTNQIFPIMPNKLIEKLEKQFDFYIWKRYDENNSVVRLVTSWATKPENVDLFLKSF